jgi:Holliday junction resolvasome RuvABC endonuclease subunit
MIILGIDVPGKYVGGYGVYDSKKDKMLQSMAIVFSERDTEQAHYRQLGNLVLDMERKYHIEAVTMEHPFLYRIAQWIGGLKMFLAYNRPEIPWVMVTTSSAQKRVYGHALKETRVNRNGRTVRANKEYVLADMQKRFSQKTLTQHQADALLYAMAGARYLENRNG